MTIVAHFKEESPDIFNNINKKEEGKVSPSGETEVPVGHIKNKIPRGPKEEESQLADYLYYFSDRKFYRINIGPKTGPGSEDPIESPHINHENFYTTYIFPDENRTGNRFIVFYDLQVKENKSPSFVVYDKLTGQFDNTSFKSIKESYKRIEAIYPVDYPAGGNYIHTAFIVVYAYMENNNMRFAAIQYEKSPNNQVIKKELGKNLIDHYYNHYEKKLAWLKESLAKNRIEIQVYDMVHRKTTPPKSLLCGKGYKPYIEFMAYNHFVIKLYNRSTRDQVHKIYRLDRDAALEYKHTKIFSKSLRHKRGEFHLLISGKRSDSKLKGLYHMEFSQNALEVGLKDGYLPGEITAKVNQNNNLCTIERTTDGYQLNAWKLSDNFKRKIKDCTIDSLPYWLKTFKKELAFKTEGNVLIIQSLGRNRGLAYITRKGEMKFKPEG